MSALQHEIITILSEFDRPIKQSWIVDYLHDRGFPVKQPSVARALKTLVTHNKIVRTACKEYHLSGLSLSFEEQRKIRHFEKYPPGHLMRTYLGIASQHPMVDMHPIKLKKYRFMIDNGMEFMLSAIGDKKCSLEAAYTVAQAFLNKSLDEMEPQLADLFKWFVCYDKQKNNRSTSNASRLAGPAQ